MVECFRCGVSGDKVRLYDAISNKGIVKFCESCANMERIPVIRKPTEGQIAEAQRHRTVQERLVGKNPKLMNKSDVTLRDLIDQKFKNRGVQNHADLVDNFHWKIQQIKRTKRITREEFAKGIGESEATVRMIEQGFLPSNDYKIINKVESFLGISLRKEGTSGFPDTSIPKKFTLDESTKGSEKKLAFDPESTKSLNIGDLKEMASKEKEKKGFFSSWFGKKKQETSKPENSSPVPDEGWEEEYPQDDERFLDSEFEGDEHPHE